MPISKMQKGPLIPLRSRTEMSDLYFLISTTPLTLVDKIIEQGYKGYKALDTRV